MSAFARSRLRTGYARRHARRHFMSECDLAQLTGFTSEGEEVWHEVIDE